MRHNRSVTDTATATHGADTPRGDRLCQARQLADIPATEMARLMGVSRKTIWNWENDRFVPNAAELRQWSTITEQPVEFLVGASMSALVAGRRDGTIPSTAAQRASAARVARFSTLQTAARKAGIDDEAFLASFMERVVDVGLDRALDDLEGLGDRPSRCTAQARLAA